MFQCNNKKKVSPFWALSSLPPSPKHTSRLCKDYLTKKESDGALHQMTCPPQLPDLNPNEMVWDDLDRRGKEKQPTCAQHMWELLQYCWKSIPSEAGLGMSSRQRVSTLKNLYLTLFWLLRYSICVIS